MTHIRNIPYGIDPVELTVSASEQDVLIRIALWQAGQSWNKIARSLNAAGYTTRAGQQWTAAGVSSLWRRGRRPAGNLHGWASVESSGLLYAFNINAVPNWCRHFVQSNEAFRNRYATDSDFRNDCTAAQLHKAAQQRLRAAAGV